MDDIAWLKELHLDLWPPKPKEKGPVIELDATRTLTREEFQRVLASITKHKLIAEMFSTSMFGGYGMRLYDHEQFPGTGAQFLVAIIEDHLPVATRYDHISGNLPPEPKRRGAGCGRDDAWAAFSKFTHSSENVEWVKKYKLELPREQSYYDY